MADPTEESRPSLNNPGIMLATWFGAGYLPKAPGTWGSVLALPFAWIILSKLGIHGLIVATVLVFLVGIWASNVFMARSGTHDPGAVVIDEVVGQWMVLAVVPLDWLWFLVGFALFRFFDIVKPWPVNVMDRKIKGGLGVMMDDVGAGFYAVAVAYGLQWFLEVAY